MHGTGAGCRVQLAGCRLQVAGCRLQVAGFRLQGSGFRVQGSGFRFVEGSGTRGLGTWLGLRVRESPGAGLGSGGREASGPRAGRADRGTTCCMAPSWRSSRRTRRPARAPARGRPELRRALERPRLWREGGRACESWVPALARPPPRRPRSSRSTRWSRSCGRLSASARATCGGIRDECARNRRGTSDYELH